MVLKVITLAEGEDTFLSNPTLGCLREFVGYFCDFIYII